MKQNTIEAFNRLPANDAIMHHKWYCTAAVTNVTDNALG